ncbi:DNA polymerase I [Bacteroidota bacterium]
MSNTIKKLFLLDAMALIYRAHFAFSKNPRINSRGMNTSAILGFTNTLLDVLNKEEPTHIGVAFDTKAPTFRHERFPEYKANREKQPEDIGIAIPYIKQIIEAFNIPVIEKDGFEADDIIGTLAKKASSKDYEVYMMTLDKDYAQLVEEKIMLFKPAYMGNAIDILGIKEVLKKFNISRVDQVRDILGLQGDSVDNIPGIPGIGQKTAVTLIRDFDTVENIVANADSLKGKLRENVENFRDQGILSKELATIKIDVPVELNEDSLKYDGPDKDKLKLLFDELEFRTLSRRVLGEEFLSSTTTTGQLSMFGSSGKDTENDVEGPSMGVMKTIDSVKHDYGLVDTGKKRTELINELSAQKEFCFDTETTSVNPLEAELVGLSFSIKKGNAWYVPVPEKKKEAAAILEEFKTVFENPEIGKIAQNIKYDYLVLKSYGIEVKGSFFDTMIAHYLFEPESRHNMDILAQNYLNYHPVSIESLIGEKGKKQGNMRDVEINKVVEYAGEDADITLQLKNEFESLLKDKNVHKLYYKVEAPLIRVLADMEFEGINISTDTLKVISEEMAKESKILEEKIYVAAEVKFNIASPKQLGDVLFEKLKLEENPKKTKTGQYATGEDILTRLAHKHSIIQDIMDFREVQKLRSTYVDALPEMTSKKDGRIHTSYNQAVAATGRLSSTNPNLQNIPVRTEKGREIRKAFIPRNEDYILLAADYSQIELRIMADFAKDETMITAFKEGKDIHSMTASKLFHIPVENVDNDMRRKAKTANFGIIYGISAFGLSQRLDIPRKEATDIIDSYFREFPSVKKYMDEVINEARENEYVETILGRRRYLRDINSRNATQRGFAERNAINAPIQGSGADMIKVAMNNISDYILKKNLKSRMILQVHDELVFDVYKPELDNFIPIVVDLMKNAITFDVPIDVDHGIGKNWLEAH